MKTSRKIFTLCLSMLSIFVFAQEAEQKPLKRISVNDFYVHPSFFAGRSTLSSVSDFRKLAPESSLLKEDFTNYNQTNTYNYVSNMMFSVMLGIQFRDEDKKSYKSNPLLRVGISYMNAPSLSNYITKTDRRPYDTLISSQTGMSTYIDSVTNRNYFMSYSSEQIRLDASLIFRTNPKARWSLYSGIGLTAGVSINAKTEINYTVSESTSDADASTYGSSGFIYGNGYGYGWTSDNSNTYYDGNTITKTEKFVNKGNSAYSFYIPMGLDFRIGKKREFWNRTHLYYEMRPGINFTSIPELRTVASANIQLGLGVRINW